MHMCGRAVVAGWLDGIFLSVPLSATNKYRTPRQTQAGIGHSAPAHRGGQVQNRIRRRQVRWGKIEHSAEAEQPRTDGGPSRQGEACQHGRGRGLAGAHRSRHPKKERCNKIRTP